MLRTLTTSLFLLLIITGSYGQRIGDNWTTVRGDDTPHQRYTLSAVTNSGRIIGVSNGGNLAWSDDAGENWEFGRIEINGLPLRGVLSVLYQKPGGPLLAVMLNLQESTGDMGPFNYYVTSYILSSSDNGISWSMSAFPKQFAFFSSTGRKYYGVNISGFHEGPGGELLAYGTTTGTNSPGFVYWSIGGAIFREAGGTWEQAHFGYGPVGKITNAGGRAVAVSHNAVLDSADGAGWNGYSMDQSQTVLNGSLMNGDDTYRLRLLDIEVLGNSYIAQGAIFVPYQGNFRIDTPYIERAFKLTSTDPFGGGRMWNAYEEPYRGLYTRSGDNIIAARPGAVFTTSSGGPGFTLASNEIFASGQAFATNGSSTVYAVESSETVWKSTTAGSAWEKVWNKDVGGNIDILGYYNGVVFGRNGYDRELWVSHDNGVTWEMRQENFRGYGNITEGGDDRLMLPGGSDGLLISDDGGLTWEPKAVSDKTGTAFVLKSTTSRLIAPATGRSTSGNGEFFVSDDNGETWSPRVVGLQWLETPRGIVQTQSGRILVPGSFYSSTGNKLYYSDDDGDSWSFTDVLQTVEGLNHVAGDPSNKVIQIKRMAVSKTGRIFIMGGNEIISSDDDGETWTVRVNMDYGYTGPWLNEDLYDIVQAGDRWFAIGAWQTPYPQRRNKYFMLVSDDDGATWGQVPFKTNMPNTYLMDLAVIEDGRLMITGGNAAVFISDPETIDPVTSPDFSIREGLVSGIPIERPDVDGPINAHFGLIGSTAVNGTDFVTNSGGLVWADNDSSMKMIEVETLDNDTVDADREFLLQVVFETQDGFLGTIDTAIGIEDDDVNGIAGLLFETPDQLYTSEAGGSMDIKVVLEGRPAKDVKVNINGLDTSEGTLSTNTVTFTTTNWNKQQTVTVTGIDDPFPDGDATYELAFALDTEDTTYADLPRTKFAVTNLGDEAYEVGGELFDGILRSFSSLPVHTTPERTLSFNVPDSIEGLTLSSEVSTNMEDWSPGPVPTAGTSENGATSYSLTVAPSETSIFVRIIFNLDQ